MRFTVIDKKTGKEADTYKIALKEDWAKGLIYCDIEGFAITEYGSLVLMDECGNVAYCPDDRFEIVFEEEEPQGDLIRRSDALKAVDNRHEELLHDTEYRRKHCDIDLLGIKKHILAIPPVDAIVDTTEVRTKGEWIDYDNTFYKCPECGYLLGKDCPRCQNRVILPKGGADNENH